MVHVSKMSTEFVQDPNDVVQIGQKVKVRVAEIDDQGRINLSMLFGEDAQKADRPREGGEHRGSFEPRGERPSFRPRMEERTPRSEHPLAQQFRRERSGPSSTWRKPGSRPGFKDRKPRY